MMQVFECFLSITLACYSCIFMMRLIYLLQDNEKKRKFDVMNGAGTSDNPENVG